MTFIKFWRFNVIGILLSAAALIIIVQMLSYQHGPQTTEIQETNASSTGYKSTFESLRGQIYDRDGHLLAGNRTVYEVTAELGQVINPKTIALAMSVLAGSDYETTYALVNQEPKNKFATVRLADFVPEEIKLQLESYAAQLAEAQPDPRDLPAGVVPDSLAGLRFQPHLERYYPEKELAAAVLGFVNQEGEGYFGVEARYQELLAGRSLEVYINNDPNQVQSPVRYPQGASLILTIDRNLQMDVQELLLQALASTGAESGTVVVMNPENGEILALASTPWIDLNQYNEIGKVFVDTTPFNRAISDAYEPGSVFKVLTMAAGLDSGTVKPDTSFLDTGVYQKGGIYIRNWNLGAFGPQTMVGCLQHSINVCMAWLADEMGAPTFYDYMRRFGIGKLTGVDLAGEAAGRLKTPGDGDWYEADLATNSFGQGLSATPMQMLMAVSAVANDGKMVVPHVLRSLIDKGSQQDYLTETVAGVPISAHTARQLTDMLTISLEEESSAALLDGYRIAGKTGTAQIPTEFGYDPTATNASFVGWGPADDPKFLIYVWLEEPESSPWGSVVAAPLFRAVAERTVVVMKIPPDAVRLAMSQE